jgi:hypothetical protein
MMRYYSVLILLGFLMSCGSQITSEFDIKAELCDEKIYQLTEAEKTHVSDNTYILLTLNCKISQLKLIQVVANQRIKEQTTDIELSISDGIITLIDETGAVGNQLLSAEFPGDQLYFYIPKPGHLIIDTGAEELNFQKFHLKSQQE